MTTALMQSHAILPRPARPGSGRQRVILLAGLLLLSGFLNQASAQVPPAALPERTKDYFTQQPADTPLVIRMDAFETEIETRVFDPKESLLKASGLPEQRLGAVYQFIEAVSKPRQLRIEVTLGHSTARSKLDMQVIRFEPGGPDKTGLMQAYRLLSAGLELERSERTDRWTMKVITLMQAAHFFDLLGMQELQLWSEFYAHLYLLRVLDDPVTAAEGAQEIYAKATRSRLDELALGALQLQASAVIAQIPKRGQNLADALFDEAQTLFQQTAAFAAKLDFQHERATAIYHSGLAFEGAGRTGEAFARFDQAIDVATGCGDTALANQIRQHAAELHEALGDNAEAIALMRQISAEIPQQEAAPEPEPEEAETPNGNEGDEREMVSYLVEQGRLLEKTYRHQEAAEVLRQALDLNQKSEDPALSGPIAIMLAKALYGAGRMEEALKYVHAGIKKTPSYRHEDVLQQAYGMLASIQRNGGHLAAMSAARKRQEMFITAPAEHAAFVFESALDQLAAEGSSSAAARTLLQQSEKEARASGARTTQYLALLQRCALGETPSGGGSSCTGEQAQTALTAIETTGLPVPRQQARLLWAQDLRRQGQFSRSMSELETLIEEMRFFHSQLRGVLGAWYYQNREHVFRTYMDLMLEQVGPPAGGAAGNAAATRSLATLKRLMDYAQEESAAIAATGDTELQKLRSLISARESAGSGDDAESLSRQILQRVRQNQGRTATAEDSTAALVRQLSQMGNDETLLSYYFSAGGAFAWVGRDAALALLRMPWSKDRSAELHAAVDGLRQDTANGRPADAAGTMDRLGQWLLAPVIKRLPKIVYFLPGGGMEGFPLDALRWKGDYLAQRHTIINLMSLDDLGSNNPQAGHNARQKFFLAGNRQEGAGDFGVLKPPSEEIRAIADMFVGPGLHIVQGAALQWDEFEDERFSDAGIVHLALPGNIDLRNPAQSRLLLSDSSANPAHQVLLPADIAGKSLSASLVVVSGCDFSGINPSAFDRNSRFVEAFLHAGAGSVLTSLWRVDDGQSAKFMRRFYRNLMDHETISDALYLTKRSYLESGGTFDSAAWASFQFFVD